MVPKEVDEMFTLTRTASRGGGKRFAVFCLLVALAVGLAACRGFFGQAPIALIVIDASGDEEVPVTVTFDISGSNDPDGTIAGFVLDVDDGTTYEGTDVSALIPHPYVAQGTYTVLLTVTDNDGRIGMVNGTVTVGPVMITFAALRTGNYDIFRMEGDGSDQGAVLITTYDELFPDLVRTTRDKIAYAAENGVSWNIWTMTVTGGSRSQLTTQTPSQQIQPSWSADAGTIAYASNDAQTPTMTTWEIYTMPAAGGTPTKLTSQSPSWAIAPVYSPVNDDVVFVSNKDSGGDSSLWLREEGGTTTEIYDTTVAGGRAGDASPAIPAPTLGLVLPATAGISQPSWSPDGSMIAFAREAGGDIDIYVVESDGSNAQSLEDYVDSVYSVTNSDITTADDEFCPFWLEDGSGLAYVKPDTGGDYQIYKVDFASGDVEPLTATGDNLSPASER